MPNARFNLAHAFSRKCAVSCGKEASANVCASTKGGSPSCWYDAEDPDGVSGASRVPVPVSSSGGGRARPPGAPSRAASSSKRSSARGSSRPPRRSQSASTASSVVLPEPSGPVSTSVCGGPSEETCARSLARTSGLGASPSPSASLCLGRPGDNRFAHARALLDSSSHTDAGVDAAASSSSAARASSSSSNASGAIPPARRDDPRCASWLRFVRSDNGRNEPRKSVDARAWACFGS